METISTISDAEALQAVRDRDARYDGKVFFAVVTTGVFCKPSCKSRQANAENVRFYPSIERAQQAGFRACKRCLPESVGESNDGIIAVARYIEAHADETLTLATLAAQFGLSPTHLQKAFKSRIGLSPKVFQDGIRQHRFKSLLRKGESVTNAVFAAGYGSSSRVYEKALDNLGMTPGNYKNGAVNEQISYSCANTRFGALMLAATDKGVCFAMFGESEQELLEKLQHEFSKAVLNRVNKQGQLNEWYQQIDRYLGSERALPSIPLDLRGTAFQMRVWSFLQSIKPGDTVSYRDVANGIDQPKAIRAAATACAKNKVALLVPCHRVLRGDGSVGGYRWGVDTKRALLSLESEAFPSSIKQARDI